MRPALLTASLLILSSLAFPAFAQEAPHLRMELLSETKTIQPGQPVTLGLLFHIEKNWHIYWTNPGDSGQTPWAQWTLPSGFKAGDIQWPIPQRLALPSLTDYGYTSEVLLMVPVEVSKKVKAGTFARLSVRVHWLACHDICIPGDSRVTLRLPVKKRTPTVNSKFKSFFDAARASLPEPFPEAWKAEGSLNSKDFKLNFQTDETVSKASFFPLKPNQIHNAAPQGFYASDHSFQLKLKRADQLLQDIKTLEGVVVMKTKSGEKGYWVAVPLAP